jgi:small redox-active disulfide protein 2
MTRTKIEILGTGCAKCKRLYQTVSEIVEEYDMDAEVIKIEDIQTLTDRGVMMTPALYVNGEAMAMGRMLSKEEIKNILGVQER